MEIEISKSDRFTQTRDIIHTLTLLSDSYIQNKNFQSIVLTKIYAGFRKFVAFFREGR